MATKEELQERAYLVRIHEANCKIEHPNEEELRFRASIMKQLGVILNLKEMRKFTIDPPKGR